MNHDDELIDNIVVFIEYPIHPKMKMLYTPADTIDEAVSLEQLTPIKKFDMEGFTDQDKRFYMANFYKKKMYRRSKIVFTDMCSTIIPVFGDTIEDALKKARECNYHLTPAPEGSGFVDQFGKFFISTTAENLLKTVETTRALN